MFYVYAYPSPFQVNILMTLLKIVYEGWGQRSRSWSELWHFPNAGPEVWRCPVGCSVWVMEVAGHHGFSSVPFLGVAERHPFVKDLSLVLSPECVWACIKKWHTCERETRDHTQTRPWLQWDSIRFLKWSLNCPKISEMIDFFFFLFIDPLVDRLNKVGACSLDLCVALLLNNSWISLALRLSGSL